MSNEQPMKTIAHTSTELSELRTAAESSSEIQLIKELQRLRDGERAQLLERYKDAIKGGEPYKDVIKGGEPYKDIFKGGEPYKDVIKGRSIDPIGLGNGDLNAPGAAAEIFRTACSLGGFMVVGMIVPMPSQPPSTNGSNGPARPLASGSRTPQQQRFFEKSTIQRMYAGAIAKWDAENH